MDKDYAALLERQAKERADLAKQLEETRPARAAERTRVEQDQPKPPHPPGITPAQQPQERIYERHLHNLGIEDKRTMGALNQRHGEERAPYEKERGEALRQGIDAYGERRSAAALGSQSRTATPHIDDKEPSKVKEVNQQEVAAQATLTQTEPAKVPPGGPQTREAEDNHQRAAEQKAAADRAADQQKLEEIRAKMAAAREKDRER
jgi:hypothetical protein